MRLRVDPLKDAAGSSFGKADRLCLYLHDQKLSSGGAPTPAGTSVFRISCSSFKEVSVAVSQRRVAMAQAAKLQADCLSRGQEEALKEKARRS